MGTCGTFTEVLSPQSLEEGLSCACLKGEMSFSSLLGRGPEGKAPNDKGFPVLLQPQLSSGALLLLFRVPQRLWVSLWLPQPAAW